MIKTSKCYNRRDFMKLAGTGFLASLVPFCRSNKNRPNILFIITDDQSWEHLGCYGDQVVRTPAIDKLATEGVKFNNAYCVAPSCSPSRAGILTGQDSFRLEEGGILTGFIREKYDVFPLMLEKAGYKIGSTGKPYGPKTKNVPGTYNLPAGKRFTKQKIEPPKGINKQDYAANFDQFLDDVSGEQPFFFWVGITEPHLPHPNGLGESSGINPEKIRIPAFYPDVPEIRSGLADYLAEIEWADKMVGRIINSLEKRNLMKNTLIVFTSDNGMPFPRAKATLYDHGVRMPLICKWDKNIKAGRVVDDPVSLIDLAPTFLELAGIEVPDQMTGRSLNKLLSSEESGKIEKNRKFVVTNFEKHCSCRKDQLGFPRRALHTEEWTYIKNYEPDRWPAGGPDVLIPGWGFYGDIDPSSIKSYFMDHKNDPEFKNIFDLCFGKVPTEELFNKKEDPDMINNLAAKPEYQNKLNELRQDLDDYLKSTKDPRINGESPWDNYNYDKPVGQVVKN
jgi:N-sulfoglucosamine sulfohydrolase